MKSKPGTYALILHSNLAAQIRIGRWGCLGVEPGYYAYVGSAFGPGGVRARVTRHFRKAKSNHWHIDYLCEAIDPAWVYFSYAPVGLEHEWALAFGRMPGTSCIDGFGSSDCRCEGHLFAIPIEPDHTSIVRALGAAGVEIRQEFPANA